MLSASGLHLQTSARHAPMLDMLQTLDTFINIRGWQNGVVHEQNTLPIAVPIERSPLAVGMWLVRLSGQN